jgi:L-lactate dehydrogenase (cytochrome)
MKPITLQELAQHGPTAPKKWTAINGIVYDLTSFQHPGGDSLIARIMGKNGSLDYNKAHQKQLVHEVLGNKIVGSLEASLTTPEAVDDEQTTLLTSEKPNISTMINTFDFEAIAKVLLAPEAWAYYSSGADDEVCLRENRLVFARLRLVPRVMINVSVINMQTTMLGCASSIPLYLSATALGRLAHEDGELAITKAGFNSQVLYMLPTLSSYSLDEMLRSRHPTQQVFSQLYVNADRQRTKEYCEALAKAGNVKALFVTVDAPQLGRREKDMRMKFGIKADVQQEDNNVPKDEGVTRSISSFIDPNLNWDDLPWLKSLGLPIVLKGIQCKEDALLAFEHGLAGIVLSNHGGRQIDGARSGLEVLGEVMPMLRLMKGYNKDKFQVFVDGGIRRGADIFKALALGARAVGIGRPVLYALASYGQPGVEKMLSIFKSELEMTMRLMGTRSIQDILQSHVIATQLTSGNGGSLKDYMLDSLYEPLQTQAQRVGFGATKPTSKM